MQNRGFDFEVSPLVQKLPQFPDDEASFHKNVTHLAIHDQIDISLTVSDFDVFQAVPLLREWKKALRQKCHFGCQDGQLSRARAKQRAFNANQIANIEQLV